MVWKRFFSENNLGPEKNLQSEKMLRVKKIVGQKKFLIKIFFDLYTMAKNSPSVANKGISEELAGG